MPPPPTPDAPTPRRRRWLQAVAVLVCVVALAFGIAAEYLARHAAPLLRDRVVATLEDRFHSPVTLDSLQVSVVRGIQVRGSGLSIQYLAGPTLPGKAQIEGRNQLRPMLYVHDFAFRASLRDLLHLRARIATVSVHGLELHIPPHSLQLSASPQPRRQPALALVAGRIACDDARVFIETSTPGKPPLSIQIINLVLTDVGTNQPFVVTETLVNPKPSGLIHATGHFGPWNGVDPRSTPIDGDYTFADADLGTIKGLGGTLSSIGHFAGQLGRVTVDGTTHTPNFSLDVSTHSLPLDTTFHALVDGTSGDTTLAPVDATLGHSRFTATGTVMKVHTPSGDTETGITRPTGHDIALQVTMPHGRIEDLLQLGMKTEPPVMRGTVSMHAKLHVPPGRVRVAQKLQLSGALTIAGVEFNNPKLQDRVDGLSLRAQGKPSEVRTAGSDHKPEVASQMSADFSLDRGLMTVPSLHYEVPGAKVQLDGVYSLDGNLFEFKGHVLTDATASQMVTGWKSMLLRPFDPLFKRNGAGVELPISLSGAKGDIRFGLATDTTKSTQAMAADLKARRAATK